MGTPLRVLIIEESDRPVQTILAQLKHGGYDPIWRRIDTSEAMLEALASGDWDVVLSTHSLPRFSAWAALRMLREKNPDVPFIIVSERLGQETAVAALKYGVQDCVSTNNLSRLNSAIEWEIREANERSARRLEEDARRENELQYRLLWETSTDAVIFMDSESRVHFANPALTAILGFRPDELIGNNLTTLMAAESALRHREGMRRYLEGGSHRPNWRSADVIGIHKDGSEVPLEASFSTLEVNEKRCFVGFLRDITARKQAEETIRRQAYQDSQTGLPNRLLFKDHLTQALAFAQRNQQRLAVFFMDLDNFKSINDTLGHAMGDRLLKEVAERLKECLRRSDVVARLGGDEFTLLLTHITRTEDTARLGQKILETLRPPFYFDGHELHITTSIGIALYPFDGEDVEALLKNADTALYRAKELGRDTYQFYNPTMNARSFERLALVNNLRRAIEREEFVVYFEPQVHIGTGRVFGIEALVRWQHPDLGLVPPLDFISVAEETGLIVPIGEWVMRTACTHLKTLQQAGFSPLYVAVNLSARQFQQQNLVTKIAQTLEETGLSPQSLVLEITETLAMQNADFTIAVLRELREMGVQISLDDFGTGYSSLSYLKKFPLHTLKIDQSFVRDCMTDFDDAAIVTAIISMAHSLKLKVIAEGVESEGHMGFLRSLRCDAMQGYLISGPIAPALLADFLTKYQERLLQGSGVRGQGAGLGDRG